MSEASFFPACTPRAATVRRTSSVQPEPSMTAVMFSMKEQNLFFVNITITSFLFSSSFQSMEEKINEGEFIVRPRERAGPVQEPAGLLSISRTWQVCAGAVREDRANLLSTK